MKSAVHQHHLKTPHSPPWTIAGVYALTCPKSTDTPRSYSVPLTETLPWWVRTLTGHNTPFFYGIRPTVDNSQTVHHSPHSCRDRVRYMYGKFHLHFHGIWGPDSHRNGLFFHWLRIDLRNGQWRIWHTLRKGTIMSTIQNEMILEDLFEEMLADLNASQLELDKSVKTMEEMAALLAYEKFEDMCQ